MKEPRYLFPNDYMADPSANVFNDRHIRYHLPEPSMHT